MRSADGHAGPPVFDADGVAEVLHALRLRGLAPFEALLAAVEALTGPLDGSTIERRPPATPTDGESIGVLLDRLVADGLARRVDLGDARWTLSAAGREVHESALARQLDQRCARPAVEAVYADFLPLNERLLDICTRWQVTDVAAGVVNDHGDADYDAAVIAELCSLHADAQPLLARLEGVLTRFSHYRRRLRAALAAVAAGQTECFAKPTVDSYHTVWFELHEDLLATLGKHRHAEAEAAPSTARHA